MIELYGSRDAITSEYLDERYLQIDHRVPYEIAGDDTGSLDPHEFMLLDASSNRAKSWSCEHCDNFLKTNDPTVCRMCFWASPENYSHIAGTEARRVELVWAGDEVTAFESLKERAKSANIDLSTYIKRKLNE